MEQNPINYINETMESDERRRQGINRQTKNIAEQLAELREVSDNSLSLYISNITVLFIHQMYLCQVTAGRSQRLI